MTPQATVIAPDGTAPWLVRRTRRALVAAGLADASSAGAPRLLVRAGAWFESAPVVWPALHGQVGLGTGDSADWRRLQARCGGDFRRLRRWFGGWPEANCLLIDPSSEPAGSLAVTRALARRLVRLPCLRDRFDPGLRVLQVVTTIQTGGAEKIALDLAAELNHGGVATAVAALADPTREAFPAPPWFFDLSDAPRSVEGRARAVNEAALAWGADLIHAHLVQADDLRAWKALGWPVVTTLHNVAQAWPRGFDSLDAAAADLVLACAKAVESEFSGPVPCRTVWNGIVPATFSPDTRLKDEALAWRRARGIGEGDLVLLSLANPRAQKRLTAWPALVRELAEALAPRPVHAVMAGGPLDHPEAVATVDEAARLGVAERFHWLGVVQDTRLLLAVADCLLSLSAWEGLSLAHLEARAAGKPVLATDAGGTREIPGVALLPFPPRAAEVLERLDRPVAAFPPSFTRHAMARRTAWLYRRVIEPLPAKRRTLWLVTNNFSTGGAQSSARRLLAGLHARGRAVRAVVLQEADQRPTPGRAALEKQGIRVDALPADAEDAVDRALELMAGDPPCAVVFWNAIATHKILLAEALFDVPVWDVSPGAMCFDSLEAWFAKPRTGLPCTVPADYGRRLAGVVVKYAREATRARALLGCPVHVVPNGIAPPPGAGAGRPTRGDSLIFSTAARLSPDKRIDELLAAVRLAAPELPPFHLRIAGGADGGNRGHVRELRRLARGLPVEWQGAVADTRALLAETDVFLMISDPPGCPNASLEALAAGVPVIATDVGGVHEQVLDGVTGRLVPPRDAPAFAAALLDLARDPHARRRMGAAARRHIEANFSLERMISAYEALFFPAEKPVESPAGPVLARAG